MKPYLDGYKLVIPSAPKPPHPGGTRIFLDRRMGITWPAANTFGYFCIFGLEDKVTVYGKTKPLVLLCEATDQIPGGRMPRRSFFGKLIARARRYHCIQFYADTRKKWDVMLASFSQVVSKRNVECEINDTSEWGGFEGMRSAVDEMGDSGLLDIPVGTIIRNEIRRLTPAEIRRSDGLPLEDRFPGAYAMSQVVTSWELYPWARPDKGSTKHKQAEGYR